MTKYEILNSNSFTHLIEDAGNIPLNSSSLSYFICIEDFKNKGNEELYFICFNIIGF